MLVDDLCEVRHAVFWTQLDCMSIVSPLGAGDVLLEDGYLTGVVGFHLVEFNRLVECGGGGGGIDV